MESKLAQIKSLLKELGSVLFAYSRGIDSTLLASLSHEILGERSLAGLQDLGYTYITLDVAGHLPASKKGSPLDRASLTL